MSAESTIATAPRSRGRQPCSPHLQTAIAAELRVWRIERKLTQQQLASLAGYHINMVAKIEQGSLMPTLTTLYRLARILRVEVSDLLPRMRELPVKHLRDGLV